MVERVHQTIRKSIIVNYIQDIKNFNIVEKLPFIINSYNSTIHSVTKFTPTEVFYSTNIELFNKVYQNIVNYYINHKDTINFIRGEKCLLRNNITKKKINKLVLIEKNNLKKIKVYIKFVL